MTVTLFLVGAIWLVLSILFVVALGVAAKKPLPME
jgi:hypothetical protein